jgi:DNA-binding XRE family transcriptional regulator
MTRFYPGSTVPFTTTVKNNGTLVDPTTITFKWKIGLWTNETVVTPTRDSLGSYSVSVPIPADSDGGNLYFRWDTDGNYDIASEGRFEHRKDKFLMTVSQLERGYIADKLLALLEKGFSIQAAAAKLRVRRQTLYDWEKADPKFEEVMEYGRGLRRYFHEERLMTSEVGPVITSSMFSLKSISDEYRDKSEVDMNHKGGINITISSDDDKL